MKHLERAANFAQEVLSPSEGRFLSPSADDGRKAKSQIKNHGYKPGSDVKGGAMKIGVYLCQVAVSDGVNFQSVADYASNLPNVEAVRLLGVKPKLDPVLLAEEIRNQKFGRVVLAGEGQRFAEIVADMTEKVRSLGPSSIKARLQTDQAER